MDSNAPTSVNHADVTGTTTSSATFYFYDKGRAFLFTKTHYHLCSNFKEGCGIYLSL